MRVAAAPRRRDRGVPIAARARHAFSSRTSEAPALHCGSKPDLASSALNDLPAWLSGEAEALNDHPLRADVGLVDALLKNMH